MYMWGMRESQAANDKDLSLRLRSEERRVGKECLKYVVYESTLSTAPRQFI